MTIRTFGITAATMMTSLCFAFVAFGQGASGLRQIEKENSAPAPRFPVNPILGVHSGKPNFGGKGVWNVHNTRDLSTKKGGAEADQALPLKPQAKAIFDERMASISKDDPEGHCLPPGIPRMMFTPFPMEILQLPDRVVFIFEGGAHIWRNIWMDGRKHSADPNPTYLGESIGHWEGDTLVVDVIGFNDRTWLDYSGHPHGEKLHVVERYSRPNLDTLLYEATIEDPDYYTAPFTFKVKTNWSPGEELMEYICQENNRDLEHLVGK